MQVELSGEAVQAATMVGQETTLGHKLLAGDAEGGTGSLGAQSTAGRGSGLRGSQGGHHLFVAIGVGENGPTSQGQVFVSGRRTIEAHGGLTEQEIWLNEFERALAVKLGRILEGKQCSREGTLMLAARQKAGGFALRCGEDLEHQLGVQLALGGAIALSECGGGSAQLAEVNTYLLVDAGFVKREVLAGAVESDAANWTEESGVRVTHFARVVGAARNRKRVQNGGIVGHGVRRDVRRPQTYRRAEFCAEGVHAIGSNRSHHCNARQCLGIPSRSLGPLQVPPHAHVHTRGCCGC
jgi:hypothetical protein